MLGSIPRRGVAPAIALFSCLAAASAPAAPPDLSSASERPDPATVQRLGPAYRYPKAGWIVLHVEGAPYERGYQHGRLLAAEIVDQIKTLATTASKAAPADGWRATRTLVNALYLRRFDAEYLEEMKGIADGASASGAAFEGRPVDVLDIAAINADSETGLLPAALDATGTGLEGKSFRAPAGLTTSPGKRDHCSAFVANGPATADGSIVFGHITMSGLANVRHYNVWLDVKPSNGHRVVMQAYPGGIQSGLDYYLNDAGLLVAETTIEQTRFDINGLSLASRIRKALQYCDTIDGAVEVLKAGNNGMYTNEWLLADTKTNEIAMFELGTHKSKLWRSGKDEWFGGTKGFYWGCNNGKDLDVRLETVPALDGRPANVVFSPSNRDRTWLRLYEKHKGKISASFGFEAFTTPPLAAFPSCDAKFTTTEMARGLKSWALFGPPLGKTWDPSERDRERHPGVMPLVPNDWVVLTPDAPAHPEPSTPAGEPAKAAADLALGVHTKGDDDDEHEPPHQAAWHGTILPKSDADTWLAAGFADYEAIVARERAIKARAKEKGRDLKASEADALAVDLFAPWSRGRTAAARLGKDVPPAETRSELARDEWYHMAAGQGVLALADLRGRMGDDAFLDLMDHFGRGHAGKAVGWDEFRAEVGARDHAAAQALSDRVTRGTGARDRPGGFWAVDSYTAELDRAVIVYGTLKESDAQREAASRLRRQVERRGPNVALPILADRDATAEALEGKHVLLVGRPDTNSVAAKLAGKLPVRFGPSSFVLRGETYGHARTAVIAAGPRPDDPRHEVVIFAGLGAEATWRSVEAVTPTAEVILLPAVGKPRPMVVGGAAGGSSVAATR